MRCTFVNAVFILAVSIVYATGPILFWKTMYQTVFKEAAKTKKMQLAVDITDAQFERLAKIVLRAVKQFDEKFPELNR